MKTNHLADSAGLLEGSNTGAAVMLIHGNPCQSRVLGLWDRGAVLLIGFLGAICLLFSWGKQRAARALAFLTLPIFAACLAFLIAFIVCFFPRIF